MVWCRCVQLTGRNVMREGRLVRARISCATVMPFMRAMLCVLALVTLALRPHPAAAAPVGVRFVEGSLHGFVVLRTLNNALIASGDLIQMHRGGAIESRMVFHFKDGSVSDETTV